MAERAWLCITHDISHEDQVHAYNSCGPPASAIRSLQGASRRPPLHSVAYDRHAIHCCAACYCPKITCTIVCATSRSRVPLLCYRYLVFGGCPVPPINARTSTIGMSPAGNSTKPRVRRPAPLAKSPSSNIIIRQPPPPTTTPPRQPPKSTPLFACGWPSPTNASQSWATYRWAKDWWCRNAGFTAADGSAA